MIKQLLKRILPDKAFNSLNQRIKRYKGFKHLQLAKKYDFDRYLESSDLKSLNSANKLLGLIIREYHAVEKGLIMPEFRLGFGKDRVISLAKNCTIFLDKYGPEDQQFQHAVAVLLEYLDIHQHNQYDLPESVTSAIESLKYRVNDITSSRQRILTREQYFENATKDFSTFSNSRASVRDYSTVSVPTKSISESLELAKNTPSACNRQPTRTYVFTNKEQIKKILEVQGGNRGFGHLADKLIIVTADNNLYTGVGERNQAFIDGGMYAMNLLYALHYNKVAACILNCSNTPAKDLTLRTLTAIKESEVFIAMISCGIPPDEFKIAVSKRYSIDVTNSVVQ